MLWRYWKAFSDLPPPVELRALLEWVFSGRGLHLYVRQQQTTARVSVLPGKPTRLVGRQAKLCVAGSSPGQALREATYTLARLRPVSPALVGS